MINVMNNVINRDLTIRMVGAVFLLIIGIIIALIIINWKLENDNLRKGIFTITKDTHTNLKTLEKLILDKKAFRKNKGAIEFLKRRCVEFISKKDNMIQKITIQILNEDELYIDVYFDKSYKEQVITRNLNSIISTKNENPEFANKQIKYQTYINTNKKHENVARIHIIDKNAKRRI